MIFIESFYTVPLKELRSAVSCRRSLVVRPPSGVGSSLQDAGKFARGRAAATHNTIHAGGNLNDPVDAGTRGVILHVEDDDSVREAIGTVLGLEGFETHEAAHGAAALGLLESLRGRLDVLIVDYHLGHGITGTEVAEDFARLLGYAVPTIMLTGDTANSEVPMLSNAPVWVARKPLDPQALIAGLPALVEFRRSMSRALRGI
jgi:CheY-like chemotaxis protein